MKGKVDFLGSGKAGKPFLCWKQQQTPAEMAAENKAEEVSEERVALLIDGCRYGDDEDVYEALKSGVSANAVDSYGRNGIHMAAANGHTEIVKLLVEAGANVGAENAEGSTPLHWACLNDHVAVVEYLLDKGAKLSACNKSGRTPFDEALTRNQKKVLDYLEARHEEGKEGAEDIDDPEKDVEEVEEYKLEDAKE